MPQPEQVDPESCFAHVRAGLDRLLGKTAPRDDPSAVMREAANLVGQLGPVMFALGWDAIGCECISDTYRPVAQWIGLVNAWWGRWRNPPSEKLALTPAIPLTPEQCSILEVLRRQHPAAQTAGKIVLALDRLYRDPSRPDGLCLVGERTVRAEVQRMFESGLVLKPPGRERKGVTISPAGLQALDCRRRLPKPAG
jgi:hypothetical protein